MTAVTRPVFADEHDDFRKSVRKFLAQHAVPLLDSWRAGGTPVEFLVAAGGEGIIGTNAAEDVGGGGVEDPRFVAVFVEELIAIGATGLAHVVALHCGLALPLVGQFPRDRFGDLLAGMASGRAIVIPVATSGPNDHVLSSGIPGGSLATAFIAIDCKSGVQSLGLAEHLEVSPVEDALGGTDCRQADLVWPGPAGGEFEVAPVDVDVLTASHHLWMAILAAAGARHALQLAGAYVRERKVFGRTLASFDNTRHRLAELHAEAEAVRRQVDQALEAEVGGRLHPVEAASALLCAQGVHDRAVDQALQFHGGYGYMREYPISHAFADAQYLRHAEAGFGDPREVIARWLEKEWAS